MVWSLLPGEGRAAPLMGARRAAHRVENYGMPTCGLMGPVGNLPETAPVSTARTGSTRSQHRVAHGRVLAGSGGALEIVGTVVGSGGVAPGRDFEELGERGGVVEGGGVGDAGQRRTLEQAFHRHLEPLAGHGVRQCL